MLYHFERLGIPVVTLDFEYDDRNAGNLEITPCKDKEAAVIIKFYEKYDTYIIA